MENVYFLPAVVQTRPATPPNPPAQNLARHEKYAAIERHGGAVSSPEAPHGTQGRGGG